MPPQPPHQRLDALMTARCMDLGIGWEELARRANLKYETIRGIRKGESRGRPLSRRAISVALGWTPDSVDRVMAGGEPELSHLSAVPLSEEDEQDAERRAIIDGVRALYPGDRVAETIVTQWHKPLEQRQRELDAYRRATTLGEQQALQPRGNEHGTITRIR